MSPRGVFAVGVFVTLLIVKPGFGGAILDSLNHVASAAFANPKPEVVTVAPPAQPVEEIIEEDKTDRFGEVVGAVNVLVARVDRVETHIAKQIEASQPTPKQVAYQRALEQQAAQEKAAGYDGADPIVRKRAGLPPKVPPFDLFMVDGEMEVSQFDREFDKRRQMH